ncbi:hypothetical protein DY000_02062343 [Brassica cretica]|uniref:Uncharacterized protein n=1 Tax=Brassica cretica TaxID=69181 RepID=A0ABQ7APT8_BRACR|nr:hypothetical protein DY000_02062343 [Brassica cretica]
MHLASTYRRPELSPDSSSTAGSCGQQRTKEESPPFSAEAHLLAGFSTGGETSRVCDMSDGIRRRRRAKSVAAVRSRFPRIVY